MLPQAVLNHSRSNFLQCLLHNMVWNHESYYIVDPKGREEMSLNLNNTAEWSLSPRESTNGLEEPEVLQHSRTH